MPVVCAAVRGRSQRARDAESGDNGGWQRTREHRGEQRYKNCETKHASIDGRVYP